MASDFLGQDSDEAVTTAPDFLGVEAPVAFEGKAALPAGGPIVGGAAPATEGGGGIVSSGLDGGVGAPGGGQGGGPTSPGALQRVMQALDALGIARKGAEQIFGGESSPGGAPVGEAGGERGQIMTADPNFDANMANFAGSLSSDAARGTVATADPNFDANMGNWLDMGGEAANTAAAATDAGMWATDATTGAGVGAASAALALIMNYIAQETGNADVGRAGTATGAAGGVGGAAIAGSPLIAFAPATLGYAGTQIAKSIDNEQRTKSDIASAKELLGTKVPDAVKALGTSAAQYDALGDLSQIPTDQLLKVTQDLETGRQALNSVDHAFKPGGIRINAGDHTNRITGIPGGLEQLNAMDPNLRQIRIQDELGRRGVDTTTIPGYRSTNEWLQGISGPAIERFGTKSTYDTTAYDPETGIPYDPTGRGFSGTPWNSLDPSFQAELDAIAPGNMESGIEALIMKYGLPQSGIPGFGQGVQQQLAQRSGDPGAPRGGDPGAPARPDSKALEQLAAFGLLPGGGAAKGEELLES